MDDFDKEICSIIAMVDANNRLECLRKVYRETVLEDGEGKNIPLEQKQFAVAESLTKGYLEAAFRLGVPVERLLNGLMINFTLPFVAAIHKLETKEGEE